MGLNLRVALQRLSFGVVLLILFYHFELESPVTVTWKNGDPLIAVVERESSFTSYYDQIGTSKDSTDSVPQQDLPSNEDLDFSDVILENIVREVIIQPKLDISPVPVPVVLTPIEYPIASTPIPIVSPVAPIPVVLEASVDPPIIPAEEEPMISVEINQSIDTFHVTPPDEILMCAPAQIYFEQSGSSSFTDLELMTKLFVDATCIGNNEISVTKKLIVFPSKVKANTFIAKFVPDEWTNSCHINVYTTDTSIVLTGVLEKSFEMIGESPFHQDPCWSCIGIFHLDIPTGNQFMLHDVDGNHFLNRTEITLARNETLKLWVVPHPFIIEIFPDILDKLLFNAFMKNEEIWQSVGVSYVYDGEHNGYELEIEAIDAGVFELTVYLGFIYPLSDIDTGEPKPILLGTHLHHESSSCDLRRNEVVDSGLHISVMNNDDDTPLLFGDGQKCNYAMEKGRWVDTLPLKESCRVPYCTGDREGSMVGSISWQGRYNSWLWVPYTCQYHLYSADDISYCAAQQNIKWILVMGDSLPREFVAYLMSLYGISDTTKFDYADIILPNGIRLTFRSWSDILTREYPGVTRDIKYLKPMLDQFNLLETNSSEGIHWPHFKTNMQPEESGDSPDVLFLNSANAYSLFLQSEEKFTMWMNDLVAVSGDVFFEGRKGDGKKTKAFWYGDPYFHGTAHEGTEFLTAGRAARFNDIARPMIESIGMSYYESTHMTRVRWDESWDGLHYLRGSTSWNGHVASSFIQAWFNELFGDCTGSLAM